MCSSMNLQDSGLARCFFRTGTRARGEVDMVFRSGHFAEISLSYISKRLDHVAHLALIIFGLRFQIKIFNLEPFWILRLIHAAFIDWYRLSLAILRVFTLWLISFKIYLHHLLNWGWHDRSKFWILGRIETVADRFSTLTTKGTCSLISVTLLSMATIILLYSSRRASSILVSPESQDAGTLVSF